MYLVCDLQEDLTGPILREVFIHFDCMEIDHLMVNLNNNSVLKKEIKNLKEKRFYSGRLTLTRGLLDSSMLKMFIFSMRVR